jgi:DNA-binding NarL/FixJ family response regulator|tara:strand:- start:1777 stop:2454 length:678 start_codon:yes stop_codon:yes gene_type:complete
MPPKQTAVTRRIFLVDDHPAFRAGMKAILGLEEGWEVCGEAGNAREALTAIEKLEPDLVLTDLSMPGRSGLELVKDLKSVAPNVRVLVMSMHEDTVYALRVLQAGGHGYLNKETAADQVVDAIRRIFDGQMMFKPEQLAQRPANLPNREASGVVEGVEFLTDRELEVFELLGHGKSTKEVAAELGMSGRTAEVHRANIKKKLGFNTAAELTHAAYQWVYQGDPGA